ncbi:UDP-N-acetylmuramoyl-L-alanine--D-glutamate ligase [Paenibacillus thalictri]|uniref:UDP-N-acetylmuramoylalanine--D-glutamate ligase n=1 Tax=Paenibacillus thalictri TaxID=2527873 RepID=A0A4Q9DST9_9BACL|nr:UDP-N-acetylmuramoyl-L-alanine--D-glutamate ligase [Paenibacillus thalictri]TBL78154.1 UDP-N-acetylmuramoyl-L-alanine--D-glutamate ligase [Paenibacillus thalictri]
MEHLGAYRGRKVVILGLARSGVAVAKLFHEMGAVCLVNDKKDRSQCPEADELTALGISVICGSHPPGLINESVSLVVKNPGIPYTIEPLQKALSLNIEIVTEVEVAYRICKAPIIGITGSNGKTTTTTWIGLMLQEAGLKPIVAGNIGRALTEAALEAESDNRMVVELSSFQLKGTDQFRPRIACLLNIAETHLDYHGSMEDYIASKAKLFDNQTAEDTAILNWDDEVCRAIAAQLKSDVLPFSGSQQLPYGVYIDENKQITYRGKGGQAHSVIDVYDLGIPGGFNAENALAATAAALTSGVPLSVIAKVLHEFKGVEHRLEQVAVRDDVMFYNNSKATNSLATIKAIDALSRPVILIAGGLDRGSDYMELLPILRERVKGIVLLGETRHKIRAVAELAGLTRVKTVDTANAQDAITEAAREASAMAEPGDAVLLSPACASWDMFPSYEERGRMFKESVHNLL